MKDKRRFETSIDLLVENEKSVSVVLHSSFSGTHKKWKKQATEQSTWFYLVHLALKQIFPDKNIRMFMHFVVSGGVQEVEVEVRDYQGALFG